MPNLNFREKPKQVVLWVLLGIGIIIFVVFRVIMTPYFNEYPVGFIESQLSFSGDAIKNHYAQMDADSIALYKIGNLLDYIYMVGYGLMLFTGVVIFLRVYSKDSFGDKVGHILAIGGIIAPVCDAIENGFILLMIANPTGFPNIIAILHSVFAAVKYSLIVSSWLFMLISLIVWISRNITNKKPKTD